VALPVAGTELTEKRLAVVVRLYALGSLAVRLGDWETLRAIVLRPAKIHPADNDYIHSSWIRHGHVEAARAGLTKDDDDTGAYMISASRRLLVAQPSMRPDLTDALVPDTGNPASDDPLLNSSCQFDILYCLLVLTEGQTSVKSMYPSSAAFDETRADPALVTVAGDSAVRATLFPNSTDADVAEAIYNVVRSLTMQEAFKFGGRWCNRDQSRTDHVSTHVLVDGPTDHPPARIEFAIKAALPWPLASQRPAPVGASVMHAAPQRTTVTCVCQVRRAKERQAD
jgi:hypothetical protein